MSEPVRRTLKQMAARWTEREGLTREPTYDEVIRRLLAAVGQPVENTTREGTQ
jgi:hypothetical protein